MKVYYGSYVLRNVCPVRQHVTVLTEIVKHVYVLHVTNTREYEKLIVQIYIINTFLLTTVQFVINFGIQPSLKMLKRY